MATPFKTAFRFFFRIALTWLAAFLLFLAFWSSVANRDVPFLVVVIWLVALAFFLSAGAWHYRRVKLLAGEVDRLHLANRQVRQIEIPFESTVAAVIVESAFRELPNVRDVVVQPGSRQINARVPRMDGDISRLPLWHRLPRSLGSNHNDVMAVLVPKEGVVSMTLVCEPEGGAWTDWFLFDDGTNLVNAEFITRAITQRIAAQRRGEQAVNKETATEKELAVAKLGLLSAQVEPHFLYNTLGSAKYLIQSDPAKAEAMLDNLILYLRNSLPRTEDAPSTLGEEVVRARAYLDILQIRMGDRLKLHFDIPAALEKIPFPTMMLQTLVENAIKHGLEPKPEGGTIWVLARADDPAAPKQLIVTVADDGCGLDGGKIGGKATSGTGIGLQNVRERLKLLYDGKASFAIASNFPSGVATTLTVPVAGPAEFKVEAKETPQ
ncbi:MAG: histidine kinase [Burkholderiales bacterium]|nr:histidine kinase [Burkholderiales bacterium]